MPNVFSDNTIISNEDLYKLSLIYEIIFNIEIFSPTPAWNEIQGVLKDINKHLKSGKSEKPPVMYYLSIIGNYVETIVANKIEDYLIDLVFKNVDELNSQLVKLRETRAAAWKEAKTLSELQDLIYQKLSFSFPYKYTPEAAIKLVKSLSAEEMTEFVTTQSDEKANALLKMIERFMFHSIFIDCDSYLQSVSVTHPIDIVMNEITRALDNKPPHLITREGVTVPDLVRIHNFTKLDLKLLSKSARDHYTAEFIFNRRLLDLRELMANGKPRVKEVFQDIAEDMDYGIKIFLANGDNCFAAEEKVYDLNQASLLKPFLKEVKEREESRDLMVKEPESWVRRYENIHHVENSSVFTNATMLSDSGPFLPAVPVPYVAFILAVQALLCLRRPIANAIKFWCRRARPPIGGYRPVVDEDENENKLDILSPTTPAKS